MSSSTNHLRMAVAALAAIVALSACGPDSSGAGNGQTPTTPTTATTPTAPTAATAPTVSNAAGEGGDAWCQSIVAMTDLMTETDSLRALAGTAVPDGQARAEKLRTLVADMEAKAPGGHDADWVVFHKTYDLWEQQLASPTPDRLGELQALTKSDAMTAAQANMHDDIVKACPNLKNLGF